MLRLRLAKQQALRLSDWEAQPLSSAQVAYAALDALACLQLHEASERKAALHITCMPCHTACCWRGPVAARQRNQPQQRIQDQWVFHPAVTWRMRLAGTVCLF